MKHTNFHEWKKDAADKGYIVKQIQGYEQHVALDGDRQMGHWATDYGTLEDPPQDSGLIPESETVPSTAADEPWVSETNVTDVKP